MKHIVFFSGGAGSWACAKRVIEKNGIENTILLFTDTGNEDCDLYRFLDDVEAFGWPILRIKNNKYSNIWDVYFKSKYMGNSRAAICSKFLKNLPAQKYIKDNFKTEECVLYLGIDWTEEHRTHSPIKHWAPYTMGFPLLSAPYLCKADILDMMKRVDIEPPRLYSLGFAHNNCGGFCVKAGLGHFKLLLDKLPDRYRYHEEMELALYKKIGHHPFLKHIYGGEKQYMTLREFRIENEKKSCQVDMFDIGGCGCFIDE